MYYDDLTSSESDVDGYRLTIDEFQMNYPREDNTLNTTDHSCIVSMRTIVDENERPILKNVQVNNCSKARYVLCQTKTLIVRNVQHGCFRRPLILGLPVLISNQLTYELCLSVCQELQTNLAIIHINECYCLQDFASKVLNLETDLQSYRQKDCGKPCSGMFQK